LLSLSIREIRRSAKSRSGSRETQVDDTAVSKGRIALPLEAGQDPHSDEDPHAPEPARRFESDGRKCLFIASEVRCGSTYIAESLAYEMNESYGFELWELTKEIFANLNDDTTPEQLLTTWRSLYFDRSGFVASKLMCKSLSYIHRLAAISPDVREAFFGANAYWIVVRRREPIEQAVSLALASKSRTFHYYGDPQCAQDSDVELTLADIDWALKAISLSDVYLQTFASSLPSERVLTFYYKDFLQDEAGHINKVRRLCNFPEMARSSYVNKSKIKRTGQSKKREAAARFSQWFLANHA
jgi:LPS sulfotransferase NodH